MRHRPLAALVPTLHDNLFLDGLVEVSLTEFWLPARELPWDESLARRDHVLPLRPPAASRSGPGALPVPQDAAEDLAGR